MSRNWSEKQSGALMGKWYSFRSTGYELLIINASDTGNSIVLEYIMEREGDIEKIEAKVPYDSTIPSISVVFPQGAQMQHEIAQRYPVRFNPGEPELQAAPGCSVMEWGPFHPLLPDPVLFRISMKDEVIDRVTVETGYHYRGVESLCTGRKVTDVMEMLERTSTVNGIPMSIAFLEAVEEINGIEIPEKARLVRMIINEFIFIGANLQSLNHTAQCLGLLADSAGVFNLTAMYQEAASLIGDHPRLLNLFEIGGLHRDISRDTFFTVNAILQDIEKGVSNILNKWANSPFIEKRLRATGKINENTARIMTGRLTRAAGQPEDTRKYSRLPYSGFSYNVPVAEGSNCFARIMLIAEDIRLSLSLIEHCIEKLQGGDIKAPGSIDGNGQVIVREPEAYGWMVMLVEQERGRISSIKIRNSTALNIPFLADCLSGTEITDLPLIVSSFDLDLPGMEK